MSYDNEKYDFIRNNEDEEYQEEYVETEEGYEEDQDSEDEEYEEGEDEEYEDEEDEEYEDEEDEEYEDEEDEEYEEGEDEEYEEGEDEEYEEGEDEEYEDEEDEEYEDEEDEEYEDEEDEEYEDEEDEEYEDEEDEEYEDEEDEEYEDEEDEEYEDEEDEEYEEGNGVYYEEQENESNSTAHLTLSDYEEAAAALGIEVAAILAVKEVELGNKPAFVNAGRPRILFEGHIFWRQLQKRGIDPRQYMQGNEEVLYPKWTRSHYTNSGQGEYARLQKAMSINEEAALASASWGMFQIMGFNYKVCGCRNVNEFVQIMGQSEVAQLQMFMNFLQANGQDKFLRNHDWAGFARSYNGPGYAQNRYDVKIRDAYNRLR